MTDVLPGRDALTSASAPARLPGVTPRVPYAEAARALLRESVLDALGDLLRQRDWSAVTMSDVSRRAGVSRQTLYNEFGSRQGLAQGYALRLAHRLVDAVGDAIYANVGDIHGALHSGFADFFAESAADPMVISLLTGEAKPELMRIVTVDSALIVVPASARLTESFMNSWVAASQEDASILARSIVRLAISYVSMPPESDHDVALDMARLLSPFVETNALADKA
ncbi:Putative transcriptional regulator, TetR family [Mycobacteroides abscessus subsp. bolletii]|uniref:TetR family transcriptional regulator n=1 Tax=Mycobacteroides abscessus subsp. bolletii TaxID=319705 RepID=A0A9Q7WHD8_9MYCO|nr:TetR family transcriptional regulator [Mycobacteroides abscessus subsp. bolletii]CPS10394.1 Putative transcriptional regulator%2C TetR family [Mycobacteroides abscessus]SKV48474.1 TetR family transcriptional regulator [Mycobacteroides abscessus subsp. abscessus]BBB43041.1 putative transcriptional regulator, TetR family protein [Mycobacteroides abscessus subsp. bolletii BD]CPS19644.1 Putative transcriptional regulator%2C TetR family [Mycobacteroides abscessus]